MFFEPGKRDRSSLARCGLIHTKRGEIATPVFIPVGTSGSVKALTMDHLFSLSAQIILANTYHLFLRPGLDVIGRFGSVHSFISWDRPLLTDSGGFQIFSIQENAKVSPEGVTFKSHIDGSKFFLSPEEVVDIQNVFDSDIQMVLDTFAPYPASRQDDVEALAITLDWAERARRRFNETNDSNHQFSIIQGGLHADLRQECYEKLYQMDFDGYAVGGLSVGEIREEFESVIATILPGMDAAKPRYLMGSGTPEEILYAVEHGVDMFDCVLPTRNARNGSLFTSRGKLVIKNERFKTDGEPLDPDCSCYTCQHFSRAYLRHLFISREITATTLNTLHNLHFYLDFMAGIRYSIGQNRFPEFKSDFLANYNQGV